MPLPRILGERLAIPAIAAESSALADPDRVIDICRAGVVGTIAALRCGSSAEFEEWLSHIQLALCDRDAPVGVNLVVHATNLRFAEELAICVEHNVELLITTRGVANDVVRRIHDYGGLVFHAVASVGQAEAAIRAGIDGVVVGGADEQAATINPFTLLPEIRRRFDGIIVLGGGIRDGRGMAAAQMLGADLALIDAASPSRAWWERLARDYRSAVGSAAAA